MGFRDRIITWLEAGRTKIEPDRQTDSYPFPWGWLGGKGSNQPTPKRTPTNLRLLSESAIPRRAINVIKDGITQLNWSVSAIDEKDAEKYTELSKIIERCLLKPNQSDSFRSFIEQIVEDMLVASAGAAEKLPAGDKMRPLRLYPVDAFSIDIYPDWDGKPASNRYSQRGVNGQAVPLKDSELMYIRMNPRSNTPFGLSPLETVWETAENFIQTHKSAGNQTKTTFLRKILNLGKDANKDQVAAFKMFWETEVMGKGTVPIIGSENPSVLNLGAVDDKGLYIEWQRFLIEIHAVAFGISPKKLGQTKDVNKSTADSEDDDTDITIQSMAENIVEYINNEIIDGVFKMGGVLEFKWHYATKLKDLKTQADIDAIYLDRGVDTIDEVRASRGKKAHENKHGEVILFPSKNKIVDINRTMEEQQPEPDPEPDKGLKARWMKANSDDKDTTEAEDEFNEAYLLLMLLLLRRGGTVSSSSLLYAWTPTQSDIQELSDQLKKLMNDSYSLSYNRRRTEMGAEPEVPYDSSIRSLANERAKLIMATYSDELTIKLNDLETKHAGLIGNEREKAIFKDAEDWLTNRMNYKAKQISDYEAGLAWNAGLFAHDAKYASDTEYIVLPVATKHDDCAWIIANAPYTKDTLPADLPLHPNCPHRYYAVNTTNK